MLDTHAVARSLTDAEIHAGPEANAITNAVRLAAEHGDHVPLDQFTGQPRRGADGDRRVAEAPVPVPSTDALPGPHSRRSAAFGSLSSRTGSRASVSMKTTRDIPIGTSIAVVAVSLNPRREERGERAPGEQDAGGVGADEGQRQHPVGDALVDAVHEQRPGEDDAAEKEGRSGGSRTGPGPACRSGPGT